MREIGIRKRNQPAPPHIIFEALTQPHRDPQRPWLMLLDDEVAPKLLKTTYPDTVVWSSLWKERPDAVIHFDLPGTRAVRAPVCGGGSRSRSPYRMTA